MEYWGGVFEICQRDLQDSLHVPKVSKIHPSFGHLPSHLLEKPSETSVTGFLPPQVNTETHNGAYTEYCSHFSGSVLAWKGGTALSFPPKT